MKNPKLAPGLVWKLILQYEEDREHEVFVKATKKMQATMRGERVSSSEDEDNDAEVYPEDDEVDDSDDDEDEAEAEKAAATALALSSPAFNSDWGAIPAASGPPPVATGPPPPLPVEEPPARSASVQPQVTTVQAVNSSTYTSTTTVPASSSSSSSSAAPAASRSVFERRRGGGGGGGGSKLTGKIIVIVLAVVFNLAFGIAALVVHGQWNGTNGQIDPPCSTASPSLSLSRWLEGFGIANILMFIAWVVVMLLCVKDDDDSLLIVVFIWAFVALLFTFAWMVVGSVVLFRDTAQCQALAYSLWACSAACVISSYIALLFPMGAVFIVK